MPFEKSLEGKNIMHLYNVTYVYNAMYAYICIQRDSDIRELWVLKNMQYM